MTTPHDTFRDQLLDLAYGELGRREARALRAHLETCAECRAELEGMNATRSAMSALEEVPAPERGENILLAAAREAARERVRKPFLPAWLWGASIGVVGVAAVAVITLKFGGDLRIRSEPDGSALVGSAPAQPQPVPAPPPPAAAAPAAEPGAGAASATGDVERHRGVEGMLGKKDAPSRPTAQPERKAKGEAADRHPAEPLQDTYAFAPPSGGAPAPAPAAPPPAKSAPAPTPPRAAPALRSNDAREAEGATAPETDAIAQADEAPTERELTAKRTAPLRESAAPAAKAAASARGEPYDPIGRYGRLRVAGELRSATRSFADCPGESARTVEIDRSGAIAKVTRVGTWAAKPFTLEQFYGERGALQAVRFQSDGRVHEQRLGPGGEGAPAAGIPAFALEPRSATQAGLDAPPRCGP